MQRRFAGGTHRATMQVLAGAGTFDSSLRVHAELWQGTCDSKRRYLASAVHPVSGQPGAPAGSSGAPGSTGDGGASGANE